MAQSGTDDPEIFNKRADILIQKLYQSMPKTYLIDSNGQEKEWIDDNLVVHYDFLKHTFYICLKLKGYDMDNSVYIDKYNTQTQNVEKDINKYDLDKEIDTSIVDIQNDESETSIFLIQMQRIQKWISYCGKNMYSKNDNVFGYLGKCKFVLMGDFNTGIHIDDYQDIQNQLSIEYIKTDPFKHKHIADKYLKFEDFIVTVSNPNNPPKNTHDDDDNLNDTTDDDDNIKLSYKKMSVLTRDLSKMFVEESGLVDYVIVFQYYIAYNNNDVSDIPEPEPEPSKSKNITLYDSALQIRTNNEMNPNFPSCHDGIVLSSYATFNCGGADFESKEKAFKDNIYEFCNRDDFTTFEENQMKEIIQKIMPAPTTGGGDNENNNTISGNVSLLQPIKLSEDIVNFFAHHKMDAFDIHLHPDVMPWLEYNNLTKKLYFYKKRPSNVESTTTDRSESPFYIIHNYGSNQPSANNLEPLTEDEKDEKHLRLDRWIQSFLNKTNINIFINEIEIGLLNAWHEILTHVDLKPKFTEIYKKQGTPIPVSIKDVVDKLFEESQSKDDCVIALQEVKKDQIEIIKKYYKVIVNQSQIDSKEYEYDTVGCLLMKQTEPPIVKQTEPPIVAEDAIPTSSTTTVITKEPDIKTPIVDDAILPLTGGKTKRRTKRHIRRRTKRTKRRVAKYYTKTHKKQNRKRKTQFI